jgi:hypothetical protein
MKLLLLGVVGTFLAGAWGALLYPATRGYGYVGHGGWQNPPSFWYFNDADTFQTRSVRGSGTRAAGQGGK